MLVDGREGSHLQALPGGELAFRSETSRKHRRLGTEEVSLGYGKAYKARAKLLNTRWCPSSLKD